MARTKEGQGTPRVPLTQIEDLMKTSGQRGDVLRAQGLTSLAAVKRAKLIQTRRERARLAVRHGESSDRVARLDRQLAVEHHFLVSTRAEADRIATPTLERINDAWQVHGYLRSRDGLPRAKYGVSLLADVDGRKTLAQTSTDGRGYFHMRLQLKGNNTGGGTGKDTDAAAGDKGGVKARAAARDQIVRVFAQSLESPAFLGVTVPGQTGLEVDERPLHPLAGGIAYRDLTVANPKDSGRVSQLRTRLLGNSGSREVHDLDNEKPRCQIAEIRPDRRFYFTSIDQAEKLGYDFCAYCFGKQRSRR